MSFDYAVSVVNLTKSYKVFRKPQDRLYQYLWKRDEPRYTEFYALRDVTFQVEKGETVGIVGQNGSGKSTLLQVIAGTLAPTSGAVDVHGRVAALLELGSGFNPDFTGRENVYLNGSILGISNDVMDRLFDQIVDFADIGDFIDRPLKVYSSGMAVRLAFAVQVMVPKDVLIVDEALAVGDELFQRKCFAQIDVFKKDGGTILFVSHSGAAVIELCDRAMFIDQGQLINIGASKNVVNLYQKYVYAPASKKEEIKRAIRGEDVSKAVAPLSLNDEQKVEKSNIQDEKLEWDESLRQNETVHYERDGVEIYDAEITTLGGRVVNVLSPDEQYIWRYRVRFHKARMNVRFGMLIKTASGLELGGANTTRPGQGIPIAEKGSFVEVEFTFRPYLNPGVYFLNAGVLCLTENGEIYVDRVIDAAAFRIRSHGNELTTALVNFDVVADVSHGIQ